MLRHGESQYKQKVLDETSKVIAQDPLAYEYDAFFDEEQERKEAALAKKKSARQNLQSRYISDMVLHAERKAREQSDAWESMQKKENLRDA